MSQFFTLPTKIGQGLISNAIAYNEPLTIATMAIGDGGGKLPAPDASVTRLVNEVRRGPINQITTDPDNPNWIIAEQVLPPDVGGWTIREVGLYDTDGNLVAYGNYPETYKPQLSEGSSRTQTIRFVMETTDTSAVTLKIDPSVVMASRKYVDDSLKAHAESRNHPDADTKNKGMLRFATVNESKKGEESKAAQTPAGGKAQLDGHREEAGAHNTGQILLKSDAPYIGSAGTTLEEALTRLKIGAVMDRASADQAREFVANDVLMTPALLDTAFRGINQSLLENGFQVLPGGLILQMVTFLFSNADQWYDVSHPIKFPATNLGVYGYVYLSSGGTAYSQLVQGTSGVGGFLTRSTRLRSSSNNATYRIFLLGR